MICTNPFTGESIVVNHDTLNHFGDKPAGKGGGGGKGKGKKGTAARRGGKQAETRDDIKSSITSRLKSQGTFAKPTSKELEGMTDHLVKGVDFNTVYDMWINDEL